MGSSPRLLLILAGALLVIAVWTFPLWSPIFENNQTEDVFPGLAASLQPAFELLPPQRQAAYRALAEQNPDTALALVQAALSPDNPVPEALQALPEMTSSRVIADGAFVAPDVLSDSEGTAVIYQFADNRRTLRLENFRVTNGPELRVILARSPNPKTAEEVGTDYIDLGALIGNVGSQNYEIPAQADLSIYQSVVIYSARFGVVFSVASLV